MIPKFRRGRSLKIQWTLYRNGELLSDDAPITIILIDSQFAKHEMPFLLRDGVCNISYPGTQHGHTGKYSLTVWYDLHHPTQAPEDAVTAFELVANTDLETSNFDLDEALLEISSNIKVGIKGDGAYESWLNVGNTGTELDFVNWMRQPAIEAGNFAQGQGNFAKEQGNFAKEQGNFAQGQGNFAKEQGNFAQGQGNFAKEQGNFAKEQGEWLQEHIENLAVFNDGVEEFDDF